MLNNYAVKASLILFILILSWSTSFPQVSELTPVIKTYKTIGDTRLSIHIFYPKDFKPENVRPAFVFFHGGGWIQGPAEWGYNICKHFTSTGMVSFSVEYRLANQSSITPVECVEDAKSAIRWIRVHAKELGIDKNKIVAAGMSAGGHIAACLGTIDGFDEKSEDLSISSRPNAIVLLAPPVDPTVDQWFIQILNNRVKPEELSPTHHVRPKLPPTLILQGNLDQTVNCETVKRFAQKMLDASNVCELHLFENRDHLYFSSVVPEITDPIDSFLCKIQLISNKHN